MDRKHAKNEKEKLRVAAKQKLLSKLKTILMEDDLLLQDEKTSKFTEVGLGLHCDSFIAHSYMCYLFSLQLYILKMAYHLIQRYEHNGIQVTLPYND